MNDHPVNITFQGPDWSSTRHEDQPDEYGITIAGFDLDYGTLTVYTNWEDGINLTLAKPSALCNEEGLPLGEIGWRIDPDPDLLQQRPELHQARGWVFGRILVTAGGHVVDRDRPQSWQDVIDIPFNGSDDPVYQETMRTAKVMAEDALGILHRTLDHLDGADETEPEFAALREAVVGLEAAGLDKFDITPTLNDR